MSSSTNNSQIDTSPVHQLFLLTFLQARIAGDYPKIPSVLPYSTWEDALGEDPLQTTASFQKNGLITRATLSEHLDYRFTRDELQQILKQKGLSTSADKADLIASLIKADKEAMQEEVSNLELLKCSELGQQVAKTYWNNPQITTNDKKISLNILRESFRWILVAAISGVIGNRADDALVTFVDYFVLQQPMVANTSQTVDTPQQPVMSQQVSPKSESYFPAFGSLSTQQPKVMSDFFVTMSGVVCDVDTKSPIQNALVYCKRTFSYYHPNISAWTFTNSEGQYQLRVMVHDTDSYVLEIGATGYLDKNLSEK